MRATLADFFAPEFSLKSTGHFIPGPDIYYPLAMLAARSIAYNIALTCIAKKVAENILWSKFMILIQLIDLGAGIFYTISGVAPIADSDFPMFNAIWISILLFLWMPKRER